MQETRRQILEILKDRGQATVDDLVKDLEILRGNITAVTVRHHLTKLQNDGLVNSCQILHRTSPGRPQHIYTLTNQGASRFPNNYSQLTSKIIEQLEQRFSTSEINVIFEDVAQSIARDANIPTGSMHERLDIATTYLNQHGYDAEWEQHPDSYILHTHNCPYHHISRDNQHLCEMDMRIISSMLGVVPRLLGRRSNGDPTCSYRIPKSDHV